MDTTGLTRSCWPQTITEIATYNHRNCHKQSQKLPHTITEIATNNHRNCHKQSQKLPQTITEIATYNHRNCFKTIIIVLSFIWLFRHFTFKTFKNSVGFYCFFNNQFFFSQIVSRWIYFNSHVMFSTTCSVMYVFYFCINIKLDIYLPLPCQYHHMRTQNRAY